MRAKKPMRTSEESKREPTSHRRSRTADRYLRRVVLHPLHGLVLLPVGFLFTFSIVLAIVGMLVVELLVFFIVPRIPRVRRAIDAEIAERRRRAAVAERMALIAQMSDHHRRDLAELERITSALRTRTELPDHFDVLGFEELIALYVRLSVAHRSTVEALNATTAPPARMAPEEEVGPLETAMSRASGPVAEALQRRLSAARRRVEARRKARAELNAIDADLATIADTIRWVQERCAGAEIPSLRRELDVALGTVGRDVETLRELCALRDDRQFDLETFELGRPTPISIRGCDDDDESSDEIKTRVAGLLETDESPPAAKAAEPLNEDAPAERYIAMALRSI